MEVTGGALLVGGAMLALLTWVIPYTLILDFILVVGLSIAYTRANREGLQDRSSYWTFEEE